jgi:ComF family protein
MTLTLHSVADTLLGLLFPDRCASCGRGGSLFCAACRAQLRAYPPGSPTVIHPADQAFPLDGAAVAFIFEGPLRDAMHCFKYKSIRRMAQPLAELLNAYLEQHPLPADAVIPVPLHRKRLRERGFNQSELLARRLSRQSGLPVLTEGLARGRHTQQQAHLDMQGRQENVRDAFVWCGPTAPPDRVLLLDDVLTTGATIGACAQTLRAAGTREVRALALGRSRPE